MIPANYARAGRYVHCDNTRININSCLGSLFQLLSLTEKSAADLKYLRDETKNAMETLQTLGCPDEHWGHILESMVVQRLYQRTRYV